MDTMKPFVITVDFQIHPGRFAEFLPLITENARLSEANEPGCRRFDVLVPEDGGNWVRLYEIYASEDAFGEHRKAAHYLGFKEATRDMIAKTSIERFALAGK